MHTMRKHLIAITVLLALTVLGSSQLWAQSVELGVHQNKIINGLQAELRGDYQENNGVPNRLTAELDHIKIPVGTPIAFCLQDSVTLIKTKVGVGKVRLLAGVRTATVELRTNDGQFVPKVTVGDTLQARQSAVAPFRTSPGCGAPLLISGKFQ